MKKILYFTLLVSLMLFSLAGCAPKQQVESTTPETAKKIQIVTTIYAPYDFTRAIVGDRAHLEMLLKPGGESHSYEPSPEDMIKIQKSDVFIYIGGENDEWVDSILESMDTKDKKIIRLMDVVMTVEEEAVEGMEAEHGHEHEHEADAKEAEHEVEYDEHIWTSPRNAMQMITAIKNVLCEIDPKNATYYTENAEAYNGEIQIVDNQIKSIVNQAEKKVLVFGDRFPFRYFADEFGLDYRAAFNGCSTETEASAKTIAYLIDYVKDNEIKFVYKIELSTGQIAQSIAEQTGAEVLTLHSCHNISKSDFEAGKTYLSLMQENAKTLQKGLGVQ